MSVSFHVGQVIFRMLPWRLTSKFFVRMEILLASLIIRIQLKLIRIMCKYMGCCVMLIIGQIRFEWRSMVARDRLNVFHNTIICKPKI